MALLVAACTPVSSGARSPAPQRGVALWSWFDLPRSDPRSRELSGIAWDEASRCLWAVQDETPDLVALVPDEGLRTWSFGPQIRVASDLADDLEGIALVAGPEAAIALASERGPHVFETDRTGRFVRDLPLPEVLGTARHNKSLESLTATPDGRALFTVSEAPLPGDLPLEHRIVRIDRQTLATTEHPYTSDAPEHGDEHGIADLAALADGDLLVLERGWAPRHGNTIRIYRTRLGVPGKTLVVDLATLPTANLGLPAPMQPQASPLLDNFEGLTEGPRLPDGRRSLVLVSDDNARPDQVARVLVLAWNGP